MLPSVRLETWKISQPGGTTIQPCMPLDTGNCCDGVMHRMWSHLLSYTPVTDGHYPSRRDTISNAPLPLNSMGEDTIAENAAAKVCKWQNARKSSSGRASVCSKESCVDSNITTNNECTAPSATAAVNGSTVQKAGKKSTSSAPLNSKLALPQLLLVVFQLLPQIWASILHHCPKTWEKEYTFNMDLN